MINLKEILTEDEYKTSEGDRITFKFEEDTEPENRGWVVHKLTAYVERNHPKFRSTKVEAGYILASYIPSREWKKRYSGDWGFVNWLQNIASGCATSISRRGNRLDAANIAFSKELDSIRDWLANNREEYDALSQDEKKVLFRDYLEKMKARCGEEFESDREFHVDKPQVDYILVEEKYRRKRIGFALYKKMAKTLAKKYGLPFYASGVQSVAAKKSWENLKQILPVKTETLTFPGGKTKTRYKIDYT